MCAHGSSLERVHSDNDIIMHDVTSNEVTGSAEGAPLGVAGSAGGSSGPVYTGRGADDAFDELEKQEQPIPALLLPAKETWQTVANQIKQLHADSNGAKIPEPMLLRLWDLASPAAREAALHDTKKELWIAMQQAVATMAYSRTDDQHLIAGITEAQDQQWMIQALRAHNEWTRKQQLESEARAASTGTTGPSSGVPAGPSSQVAATPTTSATPAAGPPKPKPNKEQRSALMMAIRAGDKAKIAAMRAQFGSEEKPEPAANKDMVVPRKRLADDAPEDERAAKKAHVEEEPLYPWRQIEDCKDARAIFSTGHDNFFVGHLSDAANANVHMNIWCGRYGEWEIRLRAAMSKTKKPAEEGAKSTEVESNKFELKIPSQSIAPPTCRGYFYGDNVSQHMVIPASHLKGLRVSDIFCLELTISDDFVKGAPTQRVCKTGPADFCDGELQAAQETIRRLFVAGTVLHCAIRPKNYRTFLQNGWVNFERAVNLHTPRYCQYQNMKGEWEFDPVRAEPIERVGNNMYETAAAYKDRTGRLVEAEYYRFKRPIGFAKVADLEIPTRMGHTREQQVGEEKKENLFLQLHAAFMTDLNVVKGKGKDAVRLDVEDAATSKGMKQYRRVFCQLSTEDDGSKAAAPLEGDRVKIDFGKQQQTGRWQSAPKTFHWDGVVVPMDPEILHKAKADFCVVAKMPDGELQPPKLRTKYPIRLSLECDRVAARREQEALVRFFATGRRSKLLRHVHQAMEDPTVASEMDHFNVLAGPESEESVTVRVERAEASTKTLQGLEDDESLNKSQARAIREMGRLLHRMGLIRGPPGTGKTWTLSHAAMILFEAGHRILVTGTTNNCVDDNTIKLYDLLVKWRKDNRGSGMTPAILRLEKGAEQSFSEKALLAMMTELGVAGDSMTITLNRLMGLRIQASKQGEELAEKFDQAINALMEEEVELMIGDDLDGNLVQAVIEAHQSSAVTASRTAAEAVRDHFITATGLIGNSKAIPIQSTLAFQAEYMVQSLIHAVEFMGEKSYVKTGGLLGPYNQMKEFVRLRQLQRDGDMPNGTMKDKLAAMWWMIKSTIVTKADIVLTTNNIAATPLAQKFGATMLLQDEGARATFAGSIVPPTCFPSLDGWIIFADERQLDAMAASEKVNEFVRAHTLSMFALLLARGFKPTSLDTQHRYPEEICEWISQHFYGDLLKTSQGKLDHPGVNTERVRNMTAEWGFVHAEGKPGSAIFGVDIKFGHHVPEENGISLQNWANAATGVKYVKALYNHGVKPKDVVYLIYYKAQKKMVRQAFKDHNIVPPGKILIINIFQGQEGSVVMVNTVMGSVLTWQELKKKFGKPTSYATKDSRLNIGITRTINAYIVLYNGDYLARYAEKTALAAIIENLEQRKLVVTEKNIKDQHPLLADARKKHEALFTTDSGKIKWPERQKMIQGKVKPQVYKTTIDIRRFDLDPDALI